MATHSITKGPLWVGRGRMDLSVKGEMGYQYGKIIYVRQTDLNVKDKAIKFLEENTEACHDLGIGSRFLKRTQNHKNDGYIELQ